MKLSFSKTSSRPKPVQTNQQEQQEYVTEFDPTEALADKSRHHRIIPPKQNEWCPYKKMKNLDLPLQSDGSRVLQFEIDTATTVDHTQTDNMSFGLHLRLPSKENADGIQGISESGSVPSETVELQSFRGEIDRLPEDRGFAEFEDCPVEGFGEALLRGYGWQEGRGIGRNAREDVKVKQYGRRGDREGIGFSSKKDKDLLPDTKSNEVNPVNEERMKENGNGFFVGKDVRVIAGRDMGYEGTILEKLGIDWVVLRLKKREEEVKVRVSDVAELGSLEEQKCLKKLKELKIREDGANRKGGERRVGERNIESVKTGNDEVRANVGKDRNNGERGVSWLRSHIRVRIISKELEGGRLYLKKGEVVDVVAPYMCDISMDENRELIQGIDQDLLETTLPKRGGPVLVLSGRHKGVYGHLVERDSDRETGVV